MIEDEIDTMVPQIGEELDQVEVRNSEIKQTISNLIENLTSTNREYGNTRLIELKQELAVLESKRLVLDASDYVSVEDITDPLLPTEFSLTVFPNPFNVTATIRYGLPYPSNVSVQIYNPLGQRMMTLFEGYMQAGVHSKNLIAKNLPSGCTLCCWRLRGKWQCKRLC